MSSSAANDFSQDARAVKEQAKESTARVSDDARE